jgi:NADH/NAD ratio-sensing transcriptional regulator Rex
VISVPDHVALRKVDLSIELQILSFYHQRSVSSAALTVELTADLGADIAVQAG